LVSTDAQEERRVDPGAELIARARSAAEVLAANAERTERDLRPAAESIAAVREAGLFALAVPAEFGGPEATMRVQVCALMELGQGCPSTAWVTGLSAGAKQMFLGALPEQAKIDLFADPDVVLAASALPFGVSATETPEGLRISGRWRIASGCEDSSWSQLVVPVDVEGQPARVALALVPTKDLVVERTWRVAGMAGTGSHTLRADDVLVPHTHARGPVPMPDFPALFPAGKTLRVAVDMLAPLVGAAQRARKVVETMFAGSRAPHGTTYGRLVESPLARHWFAEATHLVDTATTRILSVADALDTADSPLPARERARMRMELVSAASECRQAVEKLMDLHGASGFALDNPLQRLWRDVAVGTRHPALVEYVTAEDYGRILLDAEPSRLPML
jgi:alkylation response protein AidB-like acyl-CoA dehydrogenase